MKKICVVTGSRADYGLLQRLMRKLQHSAVCELQVVATGMHLSSEFGATWRAIESDGFTIDWKVDMLLSADTPVSITKSVGIGVTGFADAYHNLKPDLIVLLGDRFEILSAAIAATMSCVPIAHLHGGEVTLGSIDDTLRHSITTMSHLHLTAAEVYRQRVIQLGENPDTVWNVGGFGVDVAVHAQLMEKGDLEEVLGLALGDKSLAITFHPETGSLTDSIEKQATELLAAVAGIDAQLVFTMPNADAGGRVLFELIQSFVQENRDRACVHASLGTQAYLSLLSMCSGVVGNSSSGLLEAPAFGVGTVNIGSRQCGRLKASSVVDCAPERGSIRAAIAQILDPGIRSGKSLGIDAPYGKGGAAERAVSIIESWQPGTTNKKFFDISSDFVGAREASR